MRRRLAPGVATPTTEAVDAAARRAGATGTKILGAGGGGCVLVVLPDAALAPRVAEAVAAVEGCTLLPVRLVERGLQRIETP